MRFHRVVISSVACVDAPHRVASSELETRLAPLLTRLGMPRGVLASLSGVEARRFWDPGTLPSAVAAQAGEQAIVRSGIDRERIGVVVSTSVCRDHLEPSVACIVHRHLRLSSRCRNYDLANACLGFLTGMEIVAAMIERGECDFGLVVDGESSRPTVDATLARLAASGDARAFADEFATLTLGSGAAAMVLARDDLAPDGHRFVGAVSLAATEHNHLCRGDEERMVTDGARLLVAGLDLAQRTFDEARRELGWSPERLDEVVIHQVSRLHTEKLAAGLGIDIAKIHAIYPEHGNVGPASVPMVLAKADAIGRLRAGHRVGLLGIGSGLNCTMAEVVW